MNVIEVLGYFVIVLFQEFVNEQEVIELFSRVHGELFLSWTEKFWLTKHQKDEFFGLYNTLRKVYRRLSLAQSGHLEFLAHLPLESL